MIYEVSHRTTYRYDSPVSVSHHLLHLVPRRSERQRCLSSRVEVDPAPTRRVDDHDYFDNPTIFLTLEEPHERLAVRAASTVQVDAADATLPSATLAWEDALEQLRDPRDQHALEALEFTFASHHVPLLDPLRSYARASLPPRRELLEGVTQLCDRIYEDFAFDPTATSSATPIMSAFELRRGVCQDFAHIAIGCLRSLGLPARYVSGYLRTSPPPGKPRLVGVDMSHAWIAVWAGACGWIEFDPTNAVRPGDEHLTLAVGRDYADVSPISGVLLGGGGHHLEVAVDVVELAAGDAAGADARWLSTGGRSGAG